ncbi:MAG: Acetylornithine deacetylase, partial [uncultured Solirubrobacteraceae bacterium]
ARRRNPRPPFRRRGRRLRRAGRVPAGPRPLPVAPRRGGAAAGLDGARVRPARLRRGPLHPGRRPPARAREGRTHGGRRPGRLRAGRGRAPRREAHRAQPHPPGPHRRGAGRPGRHVDAPALRRRGPGRLAARPRRPRHEVRRVLHGVRHGRDPRRRPRARRRRVPPDRDGGGEHRQRRPFHLAARLPRRGRVDPRAHRPHHHPCPHRHGVVPLAGARRAGACRGGAERVQRHHVRLPPARRPGGAHAGAERRRRVRPLVRGRRGPDQVQPRHHPRRRLGLQHAVLVRGGLPHRPAARHGGGRR